MSTSSYPLSPAPSVSEDSEKGIFVLDPNDMMIKILDFLGY
jgi:hypothetical protein